MGEIKVVELFAGVGGLRVGLEKASKDFKTVWANQWEPGRKDQFAFHCYEEHFKDSGSVNVNDDIAKVKDQVPEHDLLVGGFPCQDYSVAATKAKGIEGKKGVLWWSIHDIIKNRHPKFVILENVDRLVRSPANQRGRDFGVILRCLADEGYNVEWRIVNAAEYGLQQRRRRTFIFACRNDVPFARTYKENCFEDIIRKEGFFARTFPITDKIDKSKTGTYSICKCDYPTLVEVSDNFEEDFYRAGVMIGYDIYTREVEPDSPKEQVTLRDILEKDVDEKYYKVDVAKWQYMKGSKSELRTRKDGGTYHYTEGAIPFPDILDRPGRTMLTSEGTVNRSSHIIEDPQTGRYRILTPVECERLNGFPDNWTDTGMSQRQRYFTMGNALVVPIIEKCGKTLIKINNGESG
ncbi:MAG: DNA (cytosine-5-)-methyltransferase [Thermoplasmata archaeon]|nr:DNA (cytosine-5-)-methyltransferase [Thermoplasmata archaeon]